MRTAEQMTIELQKVFEKLQNKEIDVREASELNNCVGKMIGLAKVELEYHALKKEKPKMAFFGDSKKANQ